MCNCGMREDNVNAVDQELPNIWPSRFAVNWIRTIYVDVRRMKQNKLEILAFTLRWKRVVDHRLLDNLLACLQGEQR